MKINFAVATKLVVSGVALISLAAPSPSIAQATLMVVSAATATGVGLASAAQHKVLSDAEWTDYEKLLCVAVLNGLTKMAANSGEPMVSSSYNNIASMVQAQLDASAPSPAQFQNMDVAARLRYGIDALTPLASSQQASALLPKVLFGLEKIKFMQLELVVDPSRQTPADLALYAVRSNALQFIADQVQQASYLAQNDPQYATAVNIILKSLTAFATSNSYAQIQSLYGSALPTLPGANSDGSYTLNEQDLVSQYQSVVGAVQAMVDSDLNAFESNGGARARKASVRAKFATRARGVRATKNSADAGGGTDSCNADACKTAQSDLTGISKLVGLVDPQLGTQISTVGTACIQAGYAMDQIFNQAVTGLAMLNPVGAIVGAGVSIFSSIFGGSGSSANAAVLQQIQKLSQQIARLQQDMDAQFAIVDATLRTILSTLSQNFALINYQLGTLNASAVQIKNALLDVESQLNAIEYYNLAYQQAEEADALMLSVNGCLNYAETHNGQDIGNGQFDNCQNIFFTWSQTNALDAIWAPLPPDYLDPGIYNFFENFANSAVCPGGCPTPFAVTINYLSQFPTQNPGMGLAPLSTAALPNPDEWTLGARMYLLMAHQWPQFASGLNVSYLNQLIQLGTILKQAAQNINSIRPSSGSISQNPALFNKLTSKYSNVVTSIQTAATAVLNNYLNNAATDGLEKNGFTLQPWAGGANQHTSSRPSVGSIQFCNGGGETLTPAPSNLFSFAPDTYAFAQGFLSLGPLTMCISNVQWINTIDPFTNPPAPGPGVTWCWDRSFDIPPSEVFGSADDCQISELQITVSVRFDGTEILTASATSWPDWIVSWWSDPTWCSQNGPCTDTSFSVDPNYAVQFLWTRSSNPSPYPFGHELSNLEGSSTVTQQPVPGLLSTVVAQIDAVAAEDEQQLYGTIASDLGTAGTDLQAASNLLSGDKFLFQAYANLGLPNSLQNDDPLHSYLYGPTGSQAIYDGAGVQSDFATFSTSPITDTTDNKINDEAAAINARLSQLTSEINTALTNIQTNQLPESLPQIDVTLKDLQAFVNLQNANALTPCSFQISPGFASVGSAGGSGTVTVQDPYGCSWTASTGLSWLTIGPSSSGSGSGTVSYSVASDTTDCGREAVVLIGDQMFYVIQTGNASDGCAGGAGGGGGGGNNPTVTLSLANIDFGNQPVGTSTAPSTVTLSNTGSAALTVDGIPVSGPYSATDTCGTVPISGSCTISVIFSPTTVGTQTGALTINDSASDSPQTVALTGVGIAIQGPTDFTVIASQVNVSKGSTGILGISTLTLTPINGFADVVHLSNCVVPAGFVGGSCSVPRSVSLTAISAAMTSVTISSTAATAGISPSSSPAWLVYSSGLTLGSVMVLGIPMRKRSWRSILGAVFCLILGAGLTACSSTSNAPATIRAGTYSFAVTATSGSLSHTVTISVDVQ